MSAIVLRHRVSLGARTVARACGFRLRSLRPGRLRWPRGLRLQINWGSSQVVTRPDVRLLNPTASVALAANKLQSLRRMQEAGVSVPPFWERAEEVERGDSTIILARTMLRASGGRGITVVRAGENLPAAPLYTKYIRKEAEYRVHVGSGRVLAVQQKRMRNGADPDANARLIRNYDNGWIFAVDNVEFATDELRDDVTRQAINAVASLGLDFGAADVIVSRGRNQRAYVLEVNTAPGIESPTVLASYTSYFQGIYNDLRN